VKSVVSDPVLIIPSLAAESLLELIPVLMKCLIVVGFPVDQNIRSTSGI